MVADTRRLLRLQPCIVFVLLQAGGSPKDAQLPLTVVG